MDVGSIGGLFCTRYQQISITIPAIAADFNLVLCLPYLARASTF